MPAPSHHPSSTASAAPQDSRNAWSEERGQSTAALTAPGPTIRFTISALNASVYDTATCLHSPPWGGQLGRSAEATTSLPQGAPLTSRSAPARYAQEGSCPSYAPDQAMFDKGIRPQAHAQ